MKNQYDHDTAGVLKPQTLPAIKSDEAKIRMLEEQLAEQHHELVRLRRDIARLKDNLTEVANFVNKRG
jgi:ribosomal protein L29